MCIRNWRNCTSKDNQIYYLLGVQDPPPKSVTIFTNLSALFWGPWESALERWNHRLFWKTGSPLSFSTVTCLLQTHHHTPPSAWTVCPGGGGGGHRNIRFEEGPLYFRSPQCQTDLPSHLQLWPYPPFASFSLRTCSTGRPWRSQKVLNILVVKNNNEEFKERIYLSHINKQKGIT